MLISIDLAQGIKETNEESYEVEMDSPPKGKNKY